jgi:DNA polymerase-3 subunit delta
MARTGLTYEQLDTAFRHRNFKPLYLLYGEETFLMDELQQVLIEHALAPHERDFNLDLVYGAEAEAQAVLALCSAFPMMAERRVVVVRGFEQLKENRMFTAYAEAPNPSAVVLLLCTGKPHMATHPYRALKKHAAWGEFKKLYDNQMPGWIQRRVQTLGYEIEPAAGHKLAH